MIAIGLVLSVLLPLAAGVPWMTLMLRDRGPGFWPLTIGYGYVLGLLAAVVWMRFLDLVHAPAGLFTIASILLVLAVLGWRKARAGAAYAREDFAASRATWRTMGRATRVVFAIVLALIALRLATLGVEILFRPIFPWEAVSAVAAKARVWFDLGNIASFVPPSRVLEGVGSYTDADASAFALPSLLLVFTAHMMMQWHEGAVAFPWWMMGLVMVLVIYGHLRRAGAGVTFALCFAYVFVSLPLVDLHIGLAGAPQWIAATGVGLAGCAMLRWLDTREREWLYCIAIGAALALMSLASTWPWFIVFALSAAIACWPRYARKLAIGVPLIVLFALLAWQQTPLKIGGAILQLQVVPTWTETVESLFLLDNWHLLYGTAILVVAIGWRIIVTPRWLPQTWLIGMGVVVLFVWGAVNVPGIWYGGLRDFSYAALQFAPMLVLWTALVARAIAVRVPQADADAPPQSPPPSLPPTRTSADPAAN